MEIFKHKFGEKIEWVSGFEELYMITSFGVVVSSAKIQNGYKEIAKKQIIDNRGYYRVSLGKDGLKITKKVHRLVAEAFIPNPNKYKEVNHIDGNKLNNHVDNLEWCTRSHNVLHAFNNGLMVSPKGEDVYNSILTNEQVSEIYTSKLSAKDISAKLGVKICNVYDIRTNRSWTHITKDLTLFKEYANENI